MRRLRLFLCCAEKQFQAAPTTRIPVSQRAVHRRFSYKEYYLYTEKDGDLTLPTGTFNENTVTVIKNTPKGWSRVKENGGIYTAELIQSYENLPSVRLSEYTDKDYYFKVTEYECALTS